MNTVKKGYACNEVNYMINHNKKNVYSDHDEKGGFQESTLVCCNLIQSELPGRIAQSVKCLTTEACLTADPGVTSLIQARSLPLVEIYREIISKVILLPSADSFKKGCCQLQGEVCTRITG